MAAIIVLQFSSYARAHDRGISSINLQYSDGKLSIYSSYANADIQELLSARKIESLKKLAEKAIRIESDGKKLDPNGSEVYLDDADGLILRHIYTELPGPNIKLISLLPPRLSPDHAQILTVTRNDGEEVTRRLLTGRGHEFVFDLENLTAPRRQ